MKYIAIWFAVSLLLSIPIINLRTQIARDEARYHVKYSDITKSNGNGKYIDGDALPNVSPNTFPYVPHRYPIKEIDDNIKSRDLDRERLIFGDFNREILVIDQGGNIILRGKWIAKDSGLAKMFRKWQ